MICPKKETQLARLGSCQLPLSPFVHVHVPPQQFSSQTVTPPACHASAAWIPEKEECTRTYYLR